MARDEEADAIAAWTSRRQSDGRRVTVIDLYRLIAEARGIEPHELSLDERKRLARTVAPVFWPGFENTEGSERSDAIVVVPYDAAWPAAFAGWHDRIAAAIGAAALRVEHVGSTSVPDLAAKPRIDIQVSVVDLVDEAQYVPQLEGDVALQLRSRDAFHRFFRPFPDQPCGVHVHVCEAGSAWERDHLLFRDYLRVHPAAVERYAAVKWQAVELWAEDGWGYTDAKTEVILDILEEAEGWATEQDWHVGRPGG